MNKKLLWPCWIVAFAALAVGGLLILGGSMHFRAVVAAAEGRPFDYRFVSLVTTSALLVFPGAICVALSPWLWMGRQWAYLTSLLSMSALMLYLVLLMYMKSQVPAESTSAGTEVYIFSALTAGVLVLLAGVLAWLRVRASRAAAAAT